MKVLLFILMSVSFSVIAQEDENGIRFEKVLNWDQIKNKAKEENKFIFVDAFATWCMPCKKMDQVVYTDTVVGKLVNAQFVSVKVQMDETTKDNEQIKSWYPIARELQKEYKIAEFPTFLFLDPHGKLVHHAFGFQNPERFMALIKQALTNPVGNYETRVKRFKDEQLAFEAMPDLSVEAWKNKDRELAVRIAKRYKEGYLDRLNDNSAFTKDHLTFLANFPTYLIKSGDRYFQLFYSHGNETDSILKRKVANSIVMAVIKKEEITDKIYKNSKPIIYPKPSWNKISEAISKKYGRSILDNIFPDAKINYYQDIKEWKEYVKAVDEKIIKYPPQVDGKLFGPSFGDPWQLNLYAWILFENCNDNKILKKALPWINLSLKLEEKEYAIDTKANILYKLGRVEEAIELEKKAILMSKNDKDMVETLESMKGGLPTWPLKN